MKVSKAIRIAMALLMVLLPLSLLACSETAPEAQTAAEETPTSVLALVTAIPSTAAPTVPDTSEEPSSEATPAPTVIPEATPDVLYNPLNGSVLGSKEDFTPFAVAVNNNEEARPQTGLSKADIIYEVYMDSGGETRLVCVFGGNLPDMVGPIRSGRIHHVHILSQFPGIAVVTVGASEKKGYNFYEQLGKAEIGWRSDAVKGPNSSLFWRDDNRYAPHNCYADLVKDREVAGDYFAKYDLPPFFTFDQDLPGKKGPGGDYTLTWFRKYVVTYEYHEDLGGYYRYYNDQLVVDAGKDIKNPDDDINVVFNNVIVMHSDYTYGGAANYANFTNTGSGPCEYLINGTYSKGTWTREKYNERFTYLDEEGNEMKFCPGKTWVDIVYDKPEQYLAKK